MVLSSSLIVSAPLVEKYDEDEERFLLRQCFAAESDEPKSNNPSTNVALKPMLN